MKKIPKQDYTVEFKEQAVKHAQAQGIGVAARELGLVEQTLRNWVKAAGAGKLAGAGANPVTAEQMELPLRSIGLKSIPYGLQACAAIDA